MVGPGNRRGSGGGHRRSILRYWVAGGSGVAGDQGPVECSRGGGGGTS